MTPILLTLLLFVLALVLAAWGLPLAQGLARAWTRTYTRLVPADQRARRIEEIESALFEQIEDDRGANYRPGEIGLRILLRVVWGVGADVTWAGAKVRLFRGWSRREKESVGLHAGVMLGSIVELVRQPWLLVDADQTIDIFGAVLDLRFVLTTLNILFPCLVALGFYVLLGRVCTLQRLAQLRLQRASLNNFNAIIGDMMRVDTVDSFNELKIMSRLEAAVDDEDLPSELSTLAGEVLARVARIDALHTACTQQEARSP